MQKISWVTRKWNYEFELFSLQLHDQPGFNLCTIHIGLRDYSLLAFKFRLPNNTNVQDFIIDDWDILFVHNYLWKHYDSLSDSKVWGSKLSKWSNAKLYILDKLF